MWNYQQQYQIPAQQVLQANGKASIAALRLAPNSSVLIMDTTAPIVWLCVSDSLGNVTPTAYDITPHKDAEVTTIETRMAAVETSLKEIMEVLNAKPDVGNARTKQTGGKNSAD